MKASTTCCTLATTIAAVLVTSCNTESAPTSALEESIEGVQYEVEGPGVYTLTFVPPGSQLPRELRESRDTPLRTSHAVLNTPLIPISGTVFYPQPGQAQFGTCWFSLQIDSQDQLYPASLHVYRLAPDGAVLNPESNPFALGSDNGMTLDEANGFMYGWRLDQLRQAAFQEGAIFAVFPGVFTFAMSSALGRGPLSGSLFVTERPVPRVTRVALPSMTTSTFASGPPFIARPDAIASAPDGTLYINELVFFGETPTLYKVTTDGTASVFATGTVNEGLRTVAVDDAGNVYWPHTNGVNKYAPDGTLLGMLPAPDDPTITSGFFATGAAFDSDGNLYLVNNADCKKIYKYPLASPASLIAGLQDEIADLIANGTISADDAEGLLDKLEAILGKIDQGNVTPAIRQLDAFIFQVQGFISDGILPPDVGADLIAAAQAAIDLLSVS